MDTPIKNKPRYAVLPKQMEFLKKLHENIDNNEYTPMEQICIEHCLTYGYYSELHQQSLNSLIKKYAHNENTK